MVKDKRIKDGYSTLCKQCKTNSKDVTKIRSDCLEYYKKNRDVCIKRNVIHITKKRRDDPIFRMVHNLRKRVSNAIKSDAGEKATGTMELLGCSVQECRDHLEKQFTEGMTWENYGKWHIDHIKPCAKFKLEDPEEQKKCFHWTNLQPLWALDNIRKGDKWEET